MMTEKQEQYAVTTVEAQDITPTFAIPLQKARQNLAELQRFVHDVMVKDVDYGEIPGVNKPTLLKPGAEKLISIYGLELDVQEIDKAEDWQNGFFYYKYRATLRMRDGRVVGVCEASCNSKESRYCWRWVPEHELPLGTDTTQYLARGGKTTEFDFAVEKAETSGKYGKPADYWQRFKYAIADGTAKQLMKETRGGKSFKAWEIDTSVYRIPNDDIYTLVNTLQKMGQKRAIVGATLIASSTSGLFTQDMEDIVEGQYTEASAWDIEPKQEAEPQQEMGNGHAPDFPAERPWTPEKVRELLTYYADTKRAKGMTGDPTPPMIGLATGKLNECFAGQQNSDNMRRDVLYYLFGVGSSKELDKAQVAAILNWIADDKDPATNDYPLKEHARAEANAIFTAQMNAAGQQELL